MTKTWRSLDISPISLRVELQIDVEDDTGSRSVGQNRDGGS